MQTYVESPEQKKLAALLEYMDKEFGINPSNIDQKLSELKKQWQERGLIGDAKNQGIQ